MSKYYSKYIYTLLERKLNAFEVLYIIFLKKSIVFIRNHLFLFLLEITYFY